MLNNIKLLTNKCQLLNKFNFNNILNKNSYFLSKYSSFLIKNVLFRNQSLQYATEPQKHKLPTNGPTLKDFISTTISEDQEIIENIPYLQNLQYGRSRKVFFDIYGCQMNFNDTEIIWSILKSNGYLKTDSLIEADVILIVTCAIREGAESKIWNKIENLKGLRKKRSKQLKIGILGCMAERLKHTLLEKEQAIDLVAGPDSYKDLPRLLALTDNNQKAVNVLLSLDETYADVMPVRLNQNSVSAFVSIMRGCDNMCTYCIVPFTRGRERSRPVESIMEEIGKLVDDGVKEVTLLGQNVNSYRDLSGHSDMTNVTSMAKGFSTVYKVKKGGLRFADLLDRVASAYPELRVRFTSPHPKDFPDAVLEVMSLRSNVCKSIHLPAQAGNSDVLARMRRGYTRNAYTQLVQHIRNLLPNVELSSDFICGFCGETEEQFQETLELMREVRYNMAYLFPYSMRQKTTAHRRYEDDVSDDVKQSRLIRMIEVYREIADQINKEKIGQCQLVLVEGDSKRSSEYFMGRNDNNIKVIFPKIEIPESNKNGITRNVKPGDYVAVRIHGANSQVLKGAPLYHSTLQNFYNNNKHIL